MKNFIKSLQSKIITGLLLLLVFACNKRQDAYAEKPEYLKNGSVFDFLTNNKEYSEFTSLLRKTGYDSLLRSSNSFTVFSVKNGSFSNIDTNSIAGLKKILGMHIVNAAVFRDKMNNSHILSMSGKLLKFATAQNGITVNGLPVNGLDTRLLNGVVQEVEGVILPMASLYETFIADPGLSRFKTFLDSSFTQVVDIEKNVRIGYDTSNLPVYQQPIVYKQESGYLNFSRINDENVVRTVFMADNNAVNQALSNLLAARSGQTDLIIPRIGKEHSDTTVGYVFLRSGMEYPGDTAILLDYLFKHGIIDKEISSLPAGAQTFDNINGEQFTVSQSQLNSNATMVSNGIYYLLNDITLPDVVYRSRFMFLPFPKVKNPANPGGSTITNPNISYANGANTSPSQSSNATCYTGKFTRFNFTKVGAQVEFTFPFATKGYYRVNLKNYLDNNGSIVSANYGSQLLKQNMNTSTQYAVAAVMVDVDLGIIQVDADGPVKITFTCAGVSPKTALKYEFCVDLVELLPVEGP